MKKKRVKKQNGSSGYKGDKCGMCYHYVRHQEFFGWCSYPLPKTAISRGLFVLEDEPSDCKVFEPYLIINGKRQIRRLLRHTEKIMDKIDAKEKK